MIIAMDGPAGSGKGTITNLVAKRLNMINIDTGATYRCIALLVLRNNLAVDDKEKIIELTKNAKIEIDEQDRVFLNGEDVSKEIRSKEVTDIVSQVSVIQEVRLILEDIQRKMAEGKNVIMEGRDITTVVFPNADYKFYLDATPEERAKRRLKQNQEEGIECSYEEILKNINERDYIDMHKPQGALLRTDDQIYIDSTNMTIDEVVEEVLKHIKEK